MDITIGWPQGIYLTVVILNLLIYAVKDGQPMDRDYKFGLYLCSSALGVFILYWGGFFS